MTDEMHEELYFNGIEYTRTSSIRAKLEAAQKMAEALKLCRDFTGAYAYETPKFKPDIFVSDALDLANEALALWHSLNGESA